ncbi:MAG TPA: BON domain-containing protein [Terriglobia bacterium]|nr:BON domain-containing protein [Terriglobia bacterium]
MKQWWIGFACGLVIGLLAYWFIEQEQNQQRIRAARNSMVSEAERVGGVLQEKVSGMRTQDIKRELEHTGVIVREKARQAGSAISDATSNTRITAAIKAKLIAEPGISAFSINVDTADGLVTLSGSVVSYEQIAKALKIAMETDGVKKVVSTLQVKPK